MNGTRIHNVVVWFIAHRANHLLHGGFLSLAKIGWVLLHCNLITGIVLSLLHAACEKVVGSSPGTANVYLYEF